MGTSVAFVCGVAVLVVGEGTPHIVSPRDVSLRDGLIAAIDPAGPECHEKPGALDGRNQVLLPGLIDVHVHLSAGRGAIPGGAGKLKIHAGKTAQDLLQHGFTTAFDPGGSQNKRIASARSVVGHPMAPHMAYASRFFTAKGGHPVAFLKAIYPLFWPALAHVAAQQIEPETPITPLVEKAQKDCASMIKVVFDDLPLQAPTLQTSLLDNVLQAANGRLPVIAHIGTPDHLRQAHAAGVRNFAHLPFRGYTPDNLAQMREQMRTLAEENGRIMSTLNVHTRVYEIARAHQDQTSVDLTTAEEDQMPGWLKADLQSVRLKGPGEDIFLAWASSVNVDAMKTVAKIAFEEGVLLMGSDSTNIGTLAGSGGLREMELLIEAGIPPLEVLEMATWDNRVWLSQQWQQHAETPCTPTPANFGAVRADWRADLLLVNCSADTLEADLSQCLLPKNTVVFKAGQRID